MFKHCNELLLPRVDQIALAALGLALPTHALINMRSIVLVLKIISVPRSTKMTKSVSATRMIATWRPLVVLKLNRH